MVCALFWERESKRSLKAKLIGSCFLLRILFKPRYSGYRAPLSYGDCAPFTIDSKTHCVLTGWLLKHVPTLSTAAETGLKATKINLCDFHAWLAFIELSFVLTWEVPSGRDGWSLPRQWSAHCEHWWVTSVMTVTSQNERYHMTIHKRRTLLIGQINASAISSRAKR